MKHTRNFNEQNFDDFMRNVKREKLISRENLDIQICHFSPSTFVLYSN